MSTVTPHFHPRSPASAVTQGFDPCPLCPASRPLHISLVSIVTPLLTPIPGVGRNGTFDPSLFPGVGRNATFNQLTTRLEHEQAVQRCQDNDPGGPGAANAWEVREEKARPPFFARGGGGCAMHDDALFRTPSLSASWVVSTQSSIVDSVFGSSPLLSPLSIPKKSAFNIWTTVYDLG